MSAGRANQLVEAGLWLRLSGDHEGAKRLFEQALRMDPSNGRAERLLNEVPSGVFDISELPAELQGQARAPQEAAGAPTGPGAMDFSVFPSSPGVAPPPVPDLSAFPPAPPAAQASRAAAERTEPNAGDEPLSLDASTGWEFNSGPSTDLPPVTASEVSNPMAWAVEPSAASRPSEDSEVRRDEVRTLLQGAQELIELDDHSGALELILKAERLAPGDPAVRQLRDRSERTLQSMYESKLGDLGSTPRVKLKDDEIIWLNLDHRAGFVLAQIDGGVTFEDVFAVSGMSRLDTARILVQLLEEGVIAV